MEVIESWLIKGVKVETRRKIRQYASQNQVTVARALDELVEIATAKVKK